MAHRQENINLVVAKLMMMAKAKWKWSKCTITYPACRSQQAKSKNFKMIDNEFNSAVPSSLKKIHAIYINEMVEV